MRIKIMRWPAPFRFAFGITDDPDQSTTKKVQIIYDYCHSLGIRPTRGTWVTKPKRTCGAQNQSLPDNGVTLEDDQYKDLCTTLQGRGIEIALHGVSSGDNKRQEIIDGFEIFETSLNNAPSTIFFHAHNAENMYWGTSHTQSTLLKTIVSLVVPKKQEVYSGHDPKSEYFCGDFMLENIKYTRLFRTRSLNVLSKNPNMPYHLTDKPFVRLWFSGTAQDLDVCERINQPALDKVANQDGLILLYAHLAEKFLDEHENIVPAAKQAFEHIGQRKDCWNAGTTDILDRCLAIKNLIITRQRAGIVISNPSSVNLHGLQFASDAKDLFLSSGQALERSNSGVYTIPNLPPQSTASVFTTKQLAHVNDPSGISKLETLRMQFEEFKRVLYSRRHNDYYSKSNYSQEELNAMSQRHTQCRSSTK